MSIKDKIKQILKGSRLGMMIYPFVARAYFLSSLPAKRRILKREGWSTLSILHEMLSDANVPYFIDFGTLLGMIRDNGFIGHDIDIDIGILGIEDGLQDKVLDVLGKIGWCLEQSYWYDGKCCSQSYSCGKIKVDFNYYDKLDDEVRCWLFLTNIKERDYPSEDATSAYEFRYRYLDEIGEVIRNGMTLRAPKDAEKLLEEKYGKNWRVPDKGWRYWEAPTARECEGFGYIKRHC